MTVLNVVFPLFAIILIGYLASVTRIVDARDIEGISRFVVMIALPILLFNSLAHVDLSAMINWQFLLAYYGVALLIYALGVLISSTIFQHTQQEQGLFGLGASFGNLMLVGYPIISVGLGEEAILPLLMLVALHSTILLTVMTVFVERGEDRAIKAILIQTLKGVIRNPIIIGLAAGLILNILSIAIPDWIQNPIDLLSRVTVPCALFVVGASLNAHRINGHFVETSTMVGFKMIVQPALVWLVVFPILHLDPLWGTVAVMTAGLPLGVNVSLFAQRYQTGIATISAATAISTLLAMISQPFFITLYLRAQGS